MSLCLHCLVSGRVQGVSFAMRPAAAPRVWVLTGWARNLPDGRVEVIACGDETPVGALRDWLARGPPQARVTEVRCDSLPFHDHGWFEIR